MFALPEGNIDLKVEELKMVIMPPEQANKKENWVHVTQVLEAQEWLGPYLRKRSAGNASMSNLQKLL